MFQVVDTTTGEMVYTHYDRIECMHWTADNEGSYRIDYVSANGGVVSGESGWQVTDPSGKVHTKKRGTRNYTHALIRQNKDDAGTDHYYVNWATSEANAYKESRVLRDVRSYIQIVKLP